MWLSILSFFLCVGGGGNKKVISRYIEQWRQASVQQQVTLPKLLEFDWRVDIKASSDTLSQMSVPSVLVGMKVSSYYL